MFRKILLGTLAFSIFFLGTNVNVFAQARAFENNQTLAISTEKSTAQKPSSPDLKKALFEKQNSTEFKEKESLAEYERQKAKGNNLSTTTKVLIGVGIAAAVIGIVIFAASRDKVETF